MLFKNTASEVILIGEIYNRIKTFINKKKEYINNYQIGLIIGKFINK